MTNIATAREHIQRCLLLLRRDDLPRQEQDRAGRHLWYHYGFLDALSSPLPNMTHPTIPLGTPYKESASNKNAQIVLQAVRQRFPDWADQAVPYTNILTLREWNKRGFRVKKGEKAIRVSAAIPVWKEDKDKGEKVQVGHRHGRAYVFALPQVEKR